MSEHATRSATARQDGIAELAQRALTATDLDALLADAADLLADGTGGRVAVLETEPDGTLRVRAAAGGTTDGSGVETGTELSGDAVAGTAIERAVAGGTTAAVDGDGDPFGADSGVYAPMTDDDGKRWGAVAVHTNGGAPTEETVGFVENAAGILGAAFGRLRSEPGAAARGEGGAVHRAAGWNGGGAGLDEVFGRVTDAFFALDSDWRFTYLNGRAEELLDREAADLIGENVWEAFPEAVGMTFEEKYEEAMETGEPVDFEEYFPPLDTWFSVRAYPSETGLSVYFRDVTERREREVELERYETILESLNDAVYAIEPDGTIQYVNPKYASMKGVDRETLTGTNIYEWVDEGTGRRANELRDALGDDDVAVLEYDFQDVEGETHPVEMRFTPVGDDEDIGRVGVIRDISDRKQYEETLTALHESSHDLLEADSRESVAAVAVETATDVLDLDATAVYLFDDDEHALRPAAYTGYVEELFEDAPPTFSSGDESILWRTFLTGERTLHGELGDDEHVNEDLDTPLRSGIWLPLGDHGVLTTLSEDADAFDDDTERLADLLATTTETALDRIERERTLQEREQDLEERNERLLELDRINTIIRDIDQALVGASTREEVEAAVCDRLTTQDGVEFAWVGAADPTTGEMAVREWAGDQQGYLDAIDLGPDSDEPARRTERSREPTVIENVADELRTEAWRKRALAGGFQSVVSVPIESDDIGYGTLSVYASEGGRIAAFADVLSELGETIGDAIDAAEARRTMHTDTGVGLDLRVDGSDPFVALAERAGCRVSFEGLITQDDSRSRVCVTAEGTDPEAALSAAEELESIAEVALLAAEPEADRALLEVLPAGPSVVTTAADLGATPTAAETDGDGTELSVVLSNTASVREFVERLRARYPDTELLARHEDERTGEPPRLFRAAVEEDLTDRQAEVLQTAYLSGYFEWPRGATGEELAEALGISQPTVNRHLRTAERKVYTRLFEN